MIWCPNTIPNLDPLEEESDEASESFESFESETKDLNVKTTNNVFDDTTVDANYHKTYLKDKTPDGDRIIFPEDY